jgi:hypothetical protein
MTEDLVTFADDAPHFHGTQSYKRTDASKDNAERHRKALMAAWDAQAAGDPGPFWALFSPDVVFHEAPCLPYGGAHRGLEATKRAHDKIYECYDRVHVDIEQVFFTGDMAIAYVHLKFRVRKNGRTGGFPLCELYRFRDGKVVEWRALYFDANMAAEALAAPALK